MKSITSCLSPLSCLKLMLLAVALPALAAASDVQAWLVLNPSTPETIMSTDMLEQSRLVHAGWKVSGTGILQTAGGADSGLLYRMVKPLPTGALRMLVVTEDELNANLKAGFVTEGALGYVSLKSGPGLIAVNRFTKDSKYLWLISSVDEAWAEKNGWKRERTVFWLWPNQYR